MKNKSEKIKAAEELRLAVIHIGNAYKLLNENKGKTAAAKLVNPISGVYAVYLTLKKGLTN